MKEDPMEVYMIRLPVGMKEALKTTAEKQGLKAPELVRLVLGWVVDGTIEVDLARPVLKESKP
ncbi:hypothetical protein LCGC14_0561900 [marine sediment metagenome]|uniref:Uncharacterized protein n=1 Tax=marine sediment metagenome TaxID=412755 RepID=A0A0F9UV06_9ZZZZ